MRIFLPGMISQLLMLCVLISERAFCETPAAQDVQQLRKITTWRASEVGPAGTRMATSSQVCGIRDLDRYSTLRLDHDVPSDLSDQNATAQVGALDRRVIAFLKEHGWSRINLGPDDGGIPNLKRCYGRQEAIVQVYETTGRCTMNSPCTAYDGFAIVFYSPKTDKSSVAHP